MDVVRLFTAEIQRKNSRIKRTKTDTKNAVKGLETMPRGGDRRTPEPRKKMTETTEIMYIVERPLYRVIVIVNGTDIDVEIVLTAKGRQYAKRRAYAHHRNITNDDDAIAEILHARDNYFPAPKPAVNSKYSFDK